MLKLSQHRPGRRMDDTGDAWQPESVASAGALPPEIPKDPMEFLSRSWSSCAIEISKVLAPPAAGGGPGSIPSDAAWELEDEGSVVSGTTFSFASSGTSQLVLERIMSQSQEVSPLTSGRLSYSSGPLNGGQSCGSLSDSPPVSPSNIDDVKQLNRVSNTPKAHYREGNKTVGRWLKDKREKKKEETRAHNAQLHAAISVAAVAAAVATIATATAATSSSSKDDRAAKTDSAVASAATLVAAQCVEAAEALGADRDHLASVVGSAVSVRSSGDIATLTAAAATALRGAATLKARALKEVWNIAAVIPVEKNHPHNQKPTDDGGGDISGELAPENFVSLCNQELLARGTELLKRTRNGDLHWKMVSVYIHRTGVVMLKMRSSHVAGAITKKKKSVVTAVCKEVRAWPGRHLLEGGERRRYFGLRTAERRVIEFECRSEREYELFTQGVPRLLDMVAKTTVG